MILKMRLKSEMKVVYGERGDVCTNIEELIAKVNSLSTFCDSLVVVVILFSKEFLNFFNKQHQCMAC
jgi:hypothetical protein